MLDHEFANVGAAVVFVQEGRLPYDGVKSGCNYCMYRAGADVGGNLGSQIWIKHFLVPHVTGVAAISPRILALTLQVGPYKLNLVSAHAPTESAEGAVKEDFWQCLQRHVVTYGREGTDLLLIGIDANARVGSVPSSMIGDQQPAGENTNGFVLRTFAEEAGLRLCNTFFLQAIPGPALLAPRIGSTIS